MAELEAYEWSNIWWEQAPDNSKPRVLIVGDSITVGYRSDVNSNLNGEIYADAYSTSKSIDNPFYIDELDLVIKQSRKDYDLIHFNCGLHGFHLSVNDYAEFYEKAVVHIIKMYPDSKLALVLSTPITEIGNPKKLDKVKNSIVENRNKAVLEIANKYSLPVNDLYSPMLNKPRLRQKDGFHYNNKGCKYQAELVSRFIVEKIKNQ